MPQSADLICNVQKTTRSRHRHSPSFDRLECCIAASKASTCQTVCTMVNLTSDCLDASLDRHRPVIGAKSYGEKAGGQMECLEQRHGAWAKGCVHARSSEASSTRPRASWRPGAQRSGSLLGGESALILQTCRAHIEMSRKSAKQFRASHGLFRECLRAGFLRQLPANRRPRTQKTLQAKPIC
jgi:hypothetical protein